MEKITQFTTCPVITVLHAEKGRLSLRVCCCDVMTVHQCWTDEGPLGFEMVVKNFLKCHIKKKRDKCALVAMWAQGDGDTLIYFSTFFSPSLSLSLPRHSEMFAALEA